VLVVLLVAAAFAISPGLLHARAAGLMLRFSSSDTPTGLANFGNHEVDEEAITLELGDGETTRARVYTPRGVSDPPGLVIAHGVHHLGVDEPRLQRFARAIASAGIVVYTPELEELADYHIDLRSTKSIGMGARALKKRVHRSSVGVMGLSFAGGLAMLTATDPEYASSISFVVAVGAHDDLPRIARFFATNEIPEADGTTLKMHAHDYGAVVLVYSQPTEFFSDQDVSRAKDALKKWLWEDEAGARQIAKEMSPAGRAKMDLIFDRREDVLAPELLAFIRKVEPAMKRVSPHDNLEGLRAHVYLLHGAGDSVIPASETRWLAHDAPEGTVKSALVSNAIQHVELEGKPKLSEQWELVHFMAMLLDEAAREAPSGN